MMPVVAPEGTSWVGLFCEEMPEARFADVIQVENSERSRSLRIPIDPRFCAVVVPGTVVVTSLVPDEPVACGARVQHGVIQLQFAGRKGRAPRAITITLSGVRRGRKDIRFPQFTAEQAMRNRKFWDQAYR
jgi:hypothetical protein